MSFPAHEAHSLTCVVFRVTQDGTASREDPKEKPETLGPWYDAPRSSTPCAEGQDTKPTWACPQPRGHGSGLSGCRPKRSGTEGPRSPCVSREGSLRRGMEQPFQEALQPPKCSQKVLVKPEACVVGMHLSMMHPQGYLGDPLCVSIPSPVVSWAVLPH